TRCYRDWSSDVCSSDLAHVLRDWTINLTGEQARGVCDLLLPEAGLLTTGQLIERIRALALAIDPAWTRRRYDEAVVGRKVIAYKIGRAAGRGRRRRVGG